MPATGAKREEGRALTPAPLFLGRSGGRAEPRRALRLEGTDPPLRSAVRRRPRRGCYGRERTLPATAAPLPASPPLRALSPKPPPSQASATRPKTPRPRDPAEPSPRRTSRRFQTSGAFPLRTGSAPATPPFSPAIGRRPPRASEVASDRANAAGRCRACARGRGSCLPPPPPPPHFTPQSTFPSLRRGGEGGSAVLFLPYEKRQFKSSLF